MTRCTTAPIHSDAAPPPRRGTTVHIDEAVTPALVDDRGFLRAGKVLEWLDVVGVLAACRYAGRAVVTASVEGVEQCAVVRVGEHVTLTADVAYAAGRSLGVSVRMTRGSDGARCLDAYLAFVAIDDGGAPIEVPALSPQTPGERARYREGQLRREFRRQLDAGETPTLASPAFPTERGQPTPEAGPPIVQWMRQLTSSLGTTLGVIAREGAVAERTPHRSYVHKIEPIRKPALNFHGTLYGGVLMDWVEATGNLSARAYLDQQAVGFRGLLAMSFLRPVPENVFVHLRAAVVHTTPAAMTTLVTVQTEEPITGEHREVAHAFVSFAPLDEAVSIPPLTIGSTEEQAVAAEVAQRLDLQRRLARE
jgi:acyl-CoA hydrolase